MNQRQKNEQIRQESMRLYGFGPEAMKQLKVCRKCHTPAAADQPFCSVCGAELPHETVYQQYAKRHRRCPCCGTVLPGTALYCPQCGLRYRKNLFSALLDSTLLRAAFRHRTGT